MDQALDGIPGTFPCADDVKMQGPIEERDDLHLLETVAKAQKAGLRFNPDKYSMKKHQIEYFGRVISSSKSSNLPLPLPLTTLTDRNTQRDLEGRSKTIDALTLYILLNSSKNYLRWGILQLGVVSTRGVASYWRGRLRHLFHRGKKIFDDQFEVLW